MSGGTDGLGGRLAPALMRSSVDAPVFAWISTCNTPPGAGTFRSSRSEKRKSRVRDRSTSLPHLPHFAFRVSPEPSNPALGATLDARHHVPAPSAPYLPPISSPN